MNNETKYVFFTIFKQKFAPIEFWKALQISIEFKPLLFKKAHCFHAHLLSIPANLI